MDPVPAPGTQAYKDQEARMSDIQVVIIPAGATEAEVNALRFPSGVPDWAKETPDAGPPAAPGTSPRTSGL